MDNGTRRKAIAKASAAARGKAEKREAARTQPAAVSGVSVGDVVALKWTGYPGVPQWLSGSRAEVLALTRTGYRVRTAAEVGAVRTIRANQVYRVMPKGTPL